MYCSFVASSLARMQKAMQTKQNIEIEEALLKEVRYEGSCFPRLLDEEGGGFNPSQHSVITDQQGERTTNHYIRAREP